MSGEVTLKDELFSLSNTARRRFPLAADPCMDQRLLMARTHKHSVSIAEHLAAVSLPVEVLSKMRASLFHPSQPKIEHGCPMWFCTSDCTACKSVPSGSLSRDSPGLASPGHLMRRSNSKTSLSKYGILRDNDGEYRFLYGLPHSPATPSSLFRFRIKPFLALLPLVSILSRIRPSAVAAGLKLTAKISHQQQPRLPVGLGHCVTVGSDLGVRAAWFSSVLVSGSFVAQTMFGRAPEQLVHKCIDCAARDWPYF